MGNDRKRLIKASAASSVAHLIAEAKKAWGKGQGGRSKRYARMAMDLVKKHKVRLTKEQKTSFCRKCLIVWVPGETVKLIYDRKHHLIRAKCGKCGYSRRL